jgi:DnaK suppressor protein
MPAKETAMTSFTIHTVARPLTDEQLAELRAMLEQQCDFRLDQLAGLRRDRQRGFPTEVDEEIARSLASGAQAALHDVLEALQRMEDGRYGSCRQCGTGLDPERLAVLPQVALCMSCQRADETA